jgi:hypothetical protein
MVSTRQARGVRDRQLDTEGTSVMTESTYPQSQPTPDADLRALDKLVGTWRISEGAQGQVTYRWMEGGFFLLQEVDLEQNGHRTQGVEITGRERPFGAEQPSEDIKSRFYDSDGNTLDYVYEPKGDSIIIWGGEKGSPAYCTVTFGEGGNTHTAEWVWPGGGYSTTATKVSG